MSFDVVTELLLDGVWTDISSDVRQSDGVQITRGRADEASTVDVSSCTLTINNTTGKYSPRNPTGAYYGVIGRNTQVRVLSGDATDNYLALPGGAASYATTDDAVSLDITGDIDIRVEVEPETWRPSGSGYGLAQKATPLNPFLRSWKFWLDESGFLNFMWCPDATISADITVKSTAAVPLTSTRLAVRVTLDVNNGAAGNTVAFSTSSSINGTYAALGSSVVTAGTTVIDANDGQLDVGRVGLTWDDTSDPDVLFHGKLYRAQVRNGIAGSIVTSPDFTLQDSGATSLTDAQSRPWSWTGRAVMVNPDTRFHGEVSSWPQRWDKTGRDVYVPIQAYGVMRRFGQGTAPLRSVFYRALTSLSDVVAYWPCEDAEGSTEFASALPEHPPMYPRGEVEMAAFEDFKASEPLPRMSGVRWIGDVLPYQNTGFTQVTFLLAVPDFGTTVSETVCLIQTTGTAPRWSLDVTPAGSLVLRAFDADGVQLFASGTTFAVNGKLMRVSVELVQVGANVEWGVATLEVGQTTGDYGSGTQASRTVGRVTRLGMNVAGAQLDETVVGHIAVQNEMTSIYTLADQLNAYSGETAAARVTRVCEEANVAVSIAGSVSESVALGPQLPMTFLEVLREAEAADMGILYEPRGFLGLAYRTRASMYAQDAALTLDYTGGTVSGIEPTEDDDGTRNDITVSRVNGSSARAQLETGPLSVLAPPDGVGRYDDEVTVSLERDEDLPYQAAWRLHVGTIDEPRYPVLGVNLANAAFTSDAGLTSDAQALEIGDRLVVTDAPAWLPPGDIQQIAQGFTESLGQYEWAIEVNCTPASVWDVAVWDDSSGPGEARYSSDGTTTTEDLTTTETGVDVTTPTGPVWSSTGVPFDIVIGGERMTVTAVTGVGTNQIFTVTRSVNGVVKTHASGAVVALYKPGIYAL